MQKTFYWGGSMKIKMKYYKDCQYIKCNSRGLHQNIGILTTEEFRKTKKHLEEMNKNLRRAEYPQIWWLEIINIKKED